MCLRKSIHYPRKPISDIADPYGYVYIIRNLITGRPYIGQKNSSVFVDTYWGSSEELLHDIKDLGVTNFSREILDWAGSKEELNQKEVYWIKTINTFKGYGYNKSIGGYGLGVREEHPCYGKHYNLGTNNAFYGKGLTITEEVRKHMSNAKKNSFGEKNNFYGHKHTEEWKEKFRKGQNNPRSKSVYQYDLSGNFVRSFSYVKETRLFGYNSDTISDRCRLKVHGEFKNERVPYKEFLWSYLSPVNNRIPSVEYEQCYQNQV